MTRQKLLVGSDLDDLASVHPDDARARAYRRQAMGDDQHRAANGCGGVLGASFSATFGSLIRASVLFRQNV